MLQWGSLLTLHINAVFWGLHHCHRCWLQQASNICTDHRLLSPLMCECNTKNEERLSEGDAHLSSLYDCRSFAADQVSVCLRSVPQDVKYAPICYPTLALDSLSELHWLWFGCSGIFWCFISFPRISPHLREKKAHWLSLKISSGLCERSPPRATQEFLVWERPKSCTIRTFDIFSAIDISLNWDLTKTSAGLPSLSWQMFVLALWTDWTVAQLKWMQSSGLLCFS